MNHKNIPKDYVILYKHNMTDYDSIPTIVQPKDLEIGLYKHQLASVYSMEKLERDKKVVENDVIQETNFGINANPTGYGKCLGRDTKIIMYDGSIKAVQDIKVGDIIMGDDSKPREILSLARGREKMYEISQNNGDNYIVNESHILSLKMSQPIRIKTRKDMVQVFYFCPERINFKIKSFKYSDYYNDINRALKDANNFADTLEIDPKIDIELLKYINLSSNIKRALKGYKVGVEFINKDVDLDPYFVGLWVGDGSKSGSQITTNDEEIVRRLKSYNIWNNKHIPSDYLVNCREKRLRLLAGLIDSDGYLQKAVYKISQKQEQLAEQIVFLCRSLGFRTRMYKREGIYTITISGKLLDKIPTLSAPKHTITSSNNDQICYRIKVKELDIDDYYGFTIGGNHRFLLHDFTVTHNTLEMVTLILRDKMEWELDLPHKEITYDILSKGRTLIKRYKSFIRLPTTLIVTNQSIINQWLKEFSYTDLDVVSIITKKDALTIDPDCYDVVIVTCTMYNKLVSRFEDCAWKRFVFDEPGHVKITSMRRVYAGFTWLITATPNLMYSLHKSCRISMLRDLIDGAGYNNIEATFKSFIIKNDLEFIKQSFSMPETIHEYYNCYDPMYRTVNGLVNSKISDMISAGNIKEAIKTLGGKETDNVIDLVKNCKEAEMNAMKNTIEMYKKQERFDLVEKYKDKVSRISNQIKELEKRFDMLLGGDCPICCIKISDPIIEPKCQNIFCGSCLLKWLNQHTSCPMCRQSIQTADLVYIKKSYSNDEDSTDDSVDDDGPVTKFRQIELIIRENPDGKFIIFSEYDQTFSNIRTFLGNNNITYSEIKGGVEQRNKNIQRFKDGLIKVLFLNSSNNGSGINLQEATDIILFHEMNDDIMKQVIGRANRIGRTESLYVHHLIST